MRIGIMLCFTISDYTMTGIPLIRLCDITEQMPRSLLKAWYQWIKSKELFPLPDGRMAAYTSDLEAFLNAHSRQYEFAEDSQENFHSEQRKALLLAYENWHKKYQDPDARPESGASDIELEVFLEEARKREYVALERLCIAYRNGIANARLSGFKITPKHIEVLDLFTANKISLLEAYKQLGIDTSTFSETIREDLNKRYIKDVYEEQRRRTGSTSD